MQSTLFYCLILMRLEFPRQILEKRSDIKFSKIPPSDGRAVQQEHVWGMEVQLQAIEGSPQKQHPSRTYWLKMGFIVSLAIQKLYIITVSVSRAVCTAPQCTDLFQVHVDL